MKILGIDPGSRKAGYGLIEVNGRKLTYLDSGVMRYDRISNFVDRLGYIYSSCEEIVSGSSPDEIAIEALIHVKNVSSLAKLAQARGAMIAAFMKSHQGQLFEYAPNLIKSSVSGFGHATKENMQKALGLILGSRDFKSHDESDALAIAICHAINRKMKIKTGSLRSM